MASRTEPAQIDDRTLISRNSSLLAAPVNDEIVMMVLDSGVYYGLDDIGSEIWRRLETPRTFVDLIDGLAADFDADRAVIAADVRELLTVMAEREVVSLTRESGS
jgi:hypothetical protein